MQDVGGCRAVVDNIARVRRIQASYRNSYIRHNLVNTDDYINTPAPSGYRGLHLIYRYLSDKNPRYNNLQIEVQLRSRLQHAWATAVETVGLFLDQSLKSSQGSRKWLNFFKLMSAEFAKVEKAPPVPGMPTIRRQLKREIRFKAKDLDVISRLHAYSAALKLIETRGRKSDYYYLLAVNPNENTLSIKRFMKREFDGASAAYDDLEKSQRTLKTGDAVLVAANSLRELRRCYPNYFADTGVFTAELTKLTA